MYYVRYFLKCCIRNIAKLICKPKVLIVLFVSVLSIFLLNNNIYALTGDDTFTDANTNIFNAYKTINYDFINRLSNSTNTDSVNSLKSLIKKGSSYYIYYKDVNGSSMLNGSPLDFSKLYILVYDKNSTFSGVANYDSYQGLNCSVKQYNKPSGIALDFIYVFNGNSLSTVTLQNVYIPQPLINYFDDKVVEYLNNNSSQQNQQIIEQLQTQTQTQEQIKNELTNTDYDDNVVNIDSSVVQNVNDTNVNNLFSTIFNNFSNLISSTNFNQVEKLQIALPFVNKSLELQSDVLSKLVNGTLLGTLINVSWYSLFGLYLFRFVSSIYRSIKSGSILNGYSFKDEVITSTML